MIGLQEQPPAVVEYITRRLSSTSRVRQIPLGVAELVKKRPFRSNFLQQLAESVQERLLRPAAYEYLFKGASEAMDMRALNSPERTKTVETPHFGLLQIEFTEIFGKPLWVISWDVPRERREFRVSGGRHNIILQERDHHTVQLTQGNVAIESVERHLLWSDEAEPHKQELRKDPDSYTSSALDPFRAVWLGHSIKSAAD